MRLAETTSDLRALSDRFGGINEAKDAAECLEHAHGQFVAHQDEGTLQTLVGAHAKAMRVRAWTSSRTKPEAV